MTLPTFLSILTIFSQCVFSSHVTLPDASFICSNLQTCMPIHFNALFNQLRWKYQTCRSSRGLWERRAWCRRPCGGVQNETLQMREGENAAHLNTADLICMLFIRGWITWTAYKPVHLAVVAMETKPHVLSLSSSREQDSTYVEVQVFKDIQWNIVLQRRSAKLQLQATRIIQQAGIVLTQTPSLIWAGGNDVHWPISINPSKCQTPPHLLLLQGYSTPLPPPLLPSQSLF